MAFLCPFDSLEIVLVAVESRKQTASHSFADRTNGIKRKKEKHQKLAPLYVRKRNVNAQMPTVGRSKRLETINQ